MKLSDIQKFKNQTGRKIREGRMLEALADMRTFSEGRMSWETTTRIDSLENSYRAMLAFFAKGIPDPSRPDIFAALCCEALALTDSLCRTAFMVDNPSLYYNTARTLAGRQPSRPMADDIKDYLAEMVRLNSDFESMANPHRSEAAEQMARDIFSRIWTAYPLSPSDFAAIDSIFSPESHAPHHLRSLVISAMTLGLLEFYDENRLVWLLARYLDSAEPEASLRALTGALIAIFRFRSRPLGRKAADALAAAKDSQAWQDDFAIATMELMRAADTERVSEKLRKEVFPSLMKIDPELEKKIRSGEITPESLAEGENPEWEEKLADSKLGQSLRELSEMQADGSDVFMGSFSHMKSFPFYSHIANWFLPFYDSHSVVSEVDSLDSSMGTLLAAMPILCDNDKYSVVLSFNAIPTGQREAMLQAMAAQSDQMRSAMSEIDRAAADTLVRRRNIINKYVQNLYRFFKLFRRKNEFFDIFAHTPFLIGIPTLASGFEDPDRLTALADFFFSHKFWPQAAATMRLLDSCSMPDGRRAQRLAYSLELSGKLDEAITAYEEAEILDGGSAWTLRHLASALRRSGKTSRAADIYKRLSDILPDDPEVAYAYACTLAESGRNSQAEAMFSKASYLMPDSLRALRGLAWTRLLCGKVQAAADAYERVLQLDPTPDDCLNAAHAARALGKMADAIALYKRYAQGDAYRLEAALEADAAALRTVGIEPESSRMIIEAIKANS